MGKTYEILQRSALHFQSGNRPVYLHVPESSVRGLFTNARLIDPLGSPEHRDEFTEAIAKMRLAYPDLSDAVFRAMVDDPDFMLVLQVSMVNEAHAAELAESY